VTNRLLTAARKHSPECIVRDKLYRVALSEKEVKQLQLPALLHPQLATWLDPKEVEEQCGTSSFGGVLLSNGCRVIHVPSYLQGLWGACQELAKDRVTWSVENGHDASDWKARLSKFDTVVLSAGSGLFHDSILNKDPKDFYVDLVRGQSIEMSLEAASATEYPNEAILCGKYFAPMPGENKVLIGATHEYQSEAFDSATVMDELRNRSYDLSPFVWDHGSVDRITSGYRVQTRRGTKGRMPIIGKAQQCDVHDNAYLFTGLSARGLIYHGIYGDLLSTAIVAQDDNILLKDHPDVLWWKE